MKKDTFQNDLEHIFSAYRYCVSCIPKDELFVNGQDVRVGSMKFENQSQAYSMRIELGWAFFTRMDACMETLAHELKVKSGGTGILDYLNQQNCILSEHEQEGLKVYREIRNTLHHG
ncbi:MAG TPA: hypothetical protein ENH23_03030 [candidate division Zixibacteria bacterium]|nr:hypothetical protein [candidate division Zixibacteria bacterium]